MKTCTVCKVEKPYSEYHKRSSVKDGHQPACKECKKLRDLKRRENPLVRKKQVEDSKAQRIRGRQAIYTYMKDRSCIKCGESSIECLQFDHRDGVDKRFNIADSVNLGYCWKTIKEEIDKCDVLCANCHHKRTAIQQGWYKGLI